MSSTPSRFSSWLPWPLFWVYNFFVIQGAVLSADLLPEVLYYFNDKLLHGSQYAVLMAAAFYAFQKAKWRWLSARPALWGFCWCVLMGILTEFLQSFETSRSTEAADFMADIAGAAIALVLSLLIVKRKEKVRD